MGVAFRRCARWFCTGPASRSGRRSCRIPGPGRGRCSSRWRACGVCRTDLHVVDGELPDPKLPLVPGHEIVGTRGRAGGRRATPWATGWACPWLGWTVRRVPLLPRGPREPLRPRPLHRLHARRRLRRAARWPTSASAFPIPAGYPDLAGRAAPVRGADRLPRARAGRRRASGSASTASARRRTSSPRSRATRAAGCSPSPAPATRGAAASPASWAPSGPAARRSAPPEPLDAAIIFAPVGALVPAALAARSARAARWCARGIHMSDIPSFPYELLWEERVRALGGQPHPRGRRGVPGAGAARPGAHRGGGVPARAEANEALGRLRAGQVRGAAVLVP